MKTWLSGSILCFASLWSYASLGYEEIIRANPAVDIAAIHWEFAREALQTADGMPTIVGVEADVDTTPESTSAAAAH